MARRGLLSSGSLNPFGGSGVDFGAFDIAGTDRESALILTRVEIEWSAGRASNATYLAALQAYAGTLTANTSQRLDAEARVETVKYRVEREVLNSQVEAGTKTLVDLLNYDKAKLTGLVQDSSEYLQRLNTYQATQSRHYSDLEEDVVRRYNDGQMTTAQLSSWYSARQQDPLLADNPNIKDAIDNRLHDLETRVISERDAKTVGDYQDGKIGPAAFIAYATSARARYVPGSTDYKDWTDRLNDAHDKSLETALLYRYDLSQQYAQLAKFVASSAAPKGSPGGTSTSKSTRTVLGADGKWHTVTTTSTKATPGHGPSPSEVAAYKQRLIEVNDAKAQMKAIQSKITGVGGFVSTDTVMGYYGRQLTKFAKGSDEWYAVQGKLDQLNDRKHQEIVMAKQGIRISYPSSGGSSVASGGSGGTSSRGAGSSARSTAGSAGPSTRAAGSDTANVNIDAFMTAIAHVESGGRYTARNASSGAYGKYQIMPANWPGWAAKYLGDPRASMTPANQEKVARAKFADLYKWLGDWRAVAHWWLTGGSNSAAHLNPSGWSSSSTRYVDNVMAGLGRGPTSGSTLKATATGPAGGVKAAGSGTTARPAQPRAGQGSGPLQVIVGETRATRSGPGQTITKRVNFPTNLDGEAFKKFYAQYEAAFKSGATEFSVDTGSGSTHYWIGDDVVERRDGMREMDQLRVNLFRERMSGYAGTASEITAANQFDNAIEDAAEHELIILDTYEKKGGSAPAPERSANPLAAGIATLERTVAAINDHIRLADEAFKRGELTTAYSHYQLAADLRANKDELIARFSAVAVNNVTAIEKAYGVGRDEALGVDASKRFQADLDTLNGFGAELEKSLAAGSETLNLLQKVIKKDSQGNPVFDQRGPGGQLMLADNNHWELQGDGSVKPVPTPVSGYDPNTGKPTRDLKGMVPIDYLSGNTTVQAFAAYKVGVVGYALGPDGATRVPIMGKTFTRRRPDGSDELWVEDPFHPGKWSSTPIAYRTPAGFKAIPGEGGQTVFEFTGMTAPGGGAKVAPRSDGFTYHLKFDPTSGTYVLYRSKPGGLFQEAVVDEELGSLADGTLAADAFARAGFARDMSSLSPDEMTFAQLGAPFVGGSPAQYKQWRNNFQSPFKPPEATMTPGDLSRRMRFDPTISRNIDLADVDPAYKPKGPPPPLSFAKLADLRRANPTISRNIDLADVPLKPPPLVALKPLYGPPTTMPVLPAGKPASTTAARLAAVKARQAADAEAARRAANLRVTAAAKPKPRPAIKPTITDPRTRTTHEIL